MPINGLDVIIDNDMPDGEIVANRFEIKCNQKTAWQIAERCDEKIIVDKINEVMHRIDR